MNLEEQGYTILASHVPESILRELRDALFE